MYPTLISLGPIRIGSFGLMLALAFVMGSFVIWKKSSEEHFEEEAIFDGILVTVFWGLLAARAGYVLMNWNDFRGDLLKMIALTRFSGLSFIIGVLAGMGALLLFAHKKRWDKFMLLDIFAQGTCLALVLGLVGAFLNGSGFGVRTNLFLGVNFIGVEGLRHPVQLYGAILYSGLFAFLVKIFAKYRTFEWYKGESSAAKSGLVFWVWMFGWGLVTALVALIKPSQKYILNYSIEGWLGVVLLITALAAGYSRSGRVFKSDISLLRAKIKKSSQGIKKIGARKRKRRERSITAGIDVK